jgi:hypothetical protein
MMAVTRKGIEVLVGLLVVLLTRIRAMTRHEPAPRDLRGIPVIRVEVVGDRVSISQPVPAAGRMMTKRMIITRGAKKNSMEANELG